MSLYHESKVFTGIEVKTQPLVLVSVRVYSYYLPWPSCVHFFQHHSSIHLSVHVLCYMLLLVVCGNYVTCFLLNIYIYIYIMQFFLGSFFFLFWTGCPAKIIVKWKTLYIFVPLLLSDIQISQTINGKSKCPWFYVYFDMFWGIICDKVFLITHKMTMAIRD